MLILFFPSFFGNDYSYVMPKSEVQGMASFYQTAQAGTIFAAATNTSQLNGRYNLFDEKILYGEDGIVSLDKSFSEKGSAITGVIIKMIPTLINRSTY